MDRTTEQKPNMPTSGMTKGHLTLINGNACPVASPPTPKQHPEGVWDLPAAPGYRRITAIDPNGNVAIELNMTERLPEPVRTELRLTIERALQRSLQALKIAIVFALAARLAFAPTSRALAAAGFELAGLLGAAGVGLRGRYGGQEAAIAFGEGGGWSVRVVPVMEPAGVNPAAQAFA